MKKAVLLFVMLLTVVSNISLSQVTNLATGNWSDKANWSTGALPTAADSVIIAKGTTVTMDAAIAECKGMNVMGTVTYPDSASRILNINGALFVDSTGKFNTFSTGSPTKLREHTITLMGDLTVIIGGSFDMRRGSNPNPAIGTVIFAGNKNSVINLSQTAYASSIEEFNSITINKTGGAKVILKSGNLYMSNNTTTGPTVLTFTSGMIETQGTSVWGQLTTSATGIVGTSSKGYVLGSLGRGMSNSAGATRTFPVGDSKGYKPVLVRSTTSQGATGAMIVVQSILGDANKSSKFSGGIDKVSGVRYFQVTYLKGMPTASATINIDSLSLSYGSDDGVVAGNKNLRVAYSTDDRANWAGLSQNTDHTTVLADTTVMINPDILSSAYTLADGKSIYVALARKTGTTENTLNAPTGVERTSEMPSSFMLSQNYPNPFNPATSIRFNLSEAGMVNLTVYNALGQAVKTIVNEYKEAGSYKVTFDASELTSGIYIYTIRANNNVQTRKMTLVK